MGMLTYLQIIAEFDRNDRRRGGCSQVHDVHEPALIEAYGAIEVAQAPSVDENLLVTEQCMCQGLKVWQHVDPTKSQAVNPIGTAVA